MKKLTVSALVLAMALQGCAGMVRPVDYRPMVDMKGIPPDQYERDVFECQAYARQIDQERSAVHGAVAGAILGTLVGAAFGLRGSNLAAVAASGAVGGSSRLAAEAGFTQLQIIARCMGGRGYNVLA